MTKTGWTDINTVAQSYSDYFLYDASFFKIDDINVGYTFRNLFNRDISLRLALTANNVAVFTRYPGVDPEISYTGIDSNGTPRSRTYSLRVNINF